MTFFKAIVCFAIFLLLFSCSEKNNNSSIKYHPTQENLEPNFNKIINISKKNKNLLEYEILNNIIDRLINYDITGIIGKKQGKSYEMLGRVEDAFYDAGSSMLYVLDSQKIGLNVYSDEGEYLHTISRMGRGPGELTNPKKLFISGDKIYILDWSFKINKYQLEGFSYDFLDEISPNFPPFGFCVSGNDIFIKSMPATNNMAAGFSESITLYKDSTFSDRLVSFGQMYKSDSWVPKVTMSMGDIECITGSDIVVQYFSHLNLLYGFRRNGKLTWVTRLKDFNFIQYREVNDRMSLRREPPYKYNSISNIVSVNGNLMLVQVATRTSGSAVIESLDTYLLNYDDGQGHFLGDNIPEILSIGPNHIVFYIEEEYPKIMIAEY